MRPRALDLFCGGGVAAEGWVAAGFDLVGVDVDPQPYYPYEFIQADAIQLLDGGDLPVDFVIASPPCQDSSAARHMRIRQGKETRFSADLLQTTINLLRGRWYHTPWVVENVDRAPGMEGALVLCGSMFPPYQMQRHRKFLSNVPLVAPGPCNHKVFPIYEPTGKPKPWGLYNRLGDDIAKAFREGRSRAPGGRTCETIEQARFCMGTERELPFKVLKEGYPPAYAEWIGRQIMEAL